tara:strand:+ start:2172 stop:2447 length:276 start_codon:yes stop_codon:yes gene_type:complete
MKVKVIVSNDCCGYKIENDQLIYNDFKGTGDNIWGEVQLFEHFSKGDIAHMKKKFGQDFRVWCSQFGDCTDQLIDTDKLVEFKEVNDEYME